MRRLWLLPLAMVLAGLSPSAASASFTWGTPAPIDPTNLETLTIACPSTTLCLTGGTRDRIGTSTNPAGGSAAWSVAGVPGLGENEKDIPSLTSIACPSTSFCVAVDDQGKLMWSENPAGGATTWQYGEVPPPSGVASRRQLGGLSCVSGSSCVAVDLTAILTGSPTSPSTWTAPAFPASAPSDSSCLPGRCVVAAGGPVLTADAPGGPWTATPVYQNGDVIRTVSCAGSFCVGGGEDGYVFWSTEPQGGVSAWHSEDLTVALSGSTCAAPGPPLCALWDYFGDFIWMSTNPTGGTTAWTLYNHVANSDDPEREDEIGGVDCPLASECFAVTRRGYVIVGSDGSLPGGNPPGGGVGPSPKTGPTGPPGTPQHVDLIKTTYGTDAVGFLLQVTEASTGTLAGVTANTYAFERPAARASISEKAKKAHVSMGSVGFSLEANEPKEVKLKLSHKFRALLAKQHKVKVKITIKLKTTATGATSTTTKTLTYKVPAKKSKNWGRPATIGLD